MPGDVDGLLAKQLHLVKTKVMSLHKESFFETFDHDLVWINPQMCSAHLVVMLITRVKS